VKRVVSYVELRGGAPIAERPTGSASAPVNGGSGNTLGPAPRSAPIEVQKL
jgi:hypothetical protein